MEKSQIELLLSMFEEYENFSKDGDLITNTLRKKLEDGDKLEQFEIEVISGHVKEMIKNLQGIDNFIDSTGLNE